MMNYNTVMRVGPLLCAPMAAFICSSVLAYPGPMRGTENIPKLMAESTLVCKGEVTEAEDVKISADPSPPHLTALATVHVDRCFKGEPETGEIVPVLFDGILPHTAGPYVVLRKGDYRLFFLKPRDGKYILADNWFGDLPISRRLGIAPDADKDPMHQLEVDLKTGLQDADPERVLDSIRMLGNMRHLRSAAELNALLDSRDPLVRTYVYEALLRLRDYSVLPAVAQWLLAQPQAPHELLLPRDALFEMQYRLATEISQIRDPSTFQVLSRLLRHQDPIIRGEVLQAVRAIHSPQSADDLLRMLDDPSSDTAYSAMQGLIEISDGKAIDWVPPLPVFRANPTYYAAHAYPVVSASHNMLWSVLAGWLGTVRLVRISL
ncbi:MAG: HEAT repeat domain-containing protein [Candidatus Acidiferrum sp.]|jgi:HEAT repeat protein